jgi:HAD superfamily hydrolase (TIGR01509 family)
MAQARGVLFDFDGTITAAGAIDFAAMRAAIGCPSGIDILGYVDTLDEAARGVALAEIDRLEAVAAEGSVPNAGAEQLLTSLHADGWQLGIITRNNLAAVEAALTNFSDVDLTLFSAVITRDDAPAKPDPTGVHMAATQMGVPASALFVVGDYIFDVEAGVRAGSATVYLSNDDPVPDFRVPPDFVISQLHELPGLLDYHVPLPAGKLPNRWLSRLLPTDACAELLVAPGVGEDAAAVRFPVDDNTDALVLKTDPITFATDAIGTYAVAVNANDLAAMGATPRWLLSSLLLPLGTTPRQVHQIIRDLAAAAAAEQIIVCGGHTEISDAVCRPVVVGQLAGVAASDRLVRKQAMQPGDQVVLTKGVAVEGTCILGRELGERLLAAGVPRTAVARAAAFLSEPGISVRQEAAIAAATPGLAAMHDVTEGGLATAVAELSVAGGRGIHIVMDAIPVYHETRVICAALGLDPLGLIGSGSLLIVCRAPAAAQLVSDIIEAGIDAAVIGDVTAAPAGVTATAGEGAGDWPVFAADEIARAFTAATG